MLRAPSEGHMLLYVPSGRKYLFQLVTRSPYSLFKGTGGYDLHFSAAAGGAYSINWAHMEYLFILGSRLRARSDVEALCTRSQLSCTTCQRPCLIYLGCDAARKHPDEIFSTRRSDNKGAGKPSACTVIVSCRANVLFLLKGY